METQDLEIVWTTSEKEVALKVILKYALNSKTKGWWQNVNIILWGPAVKLVAEDAQIQSEFLELLHKGITSEACLDCAESYGVIEKLSKINVDVKPMGERFSNYIKEKRNIVTF